MTTAKRNLIANGQPFHILINTNERTHSMPITEDDFQALIREHPRIPLHLAFKHLSADTASEDEDVREFASAYPHLMAGYDNPGTVIAKAVDMEIAYADNYRRALRGDPDPILGHVDTVDEIMRDFGRSSGPEAWALDRVNGR